MKRPSYRAGIAWIALNDDSGSKDCLDLVVVSEYLSVALLADLFAVTCRDVAESVVMYRIKQGFDSPKGYGC